MVETLRYSVELDQTGLQSQLSSLSQTVTAGLNSLYTGGAQGFQTVSIAGQSLQRDLGSIFGPPMQTSAAGAYGDFSSPTNSLAYQINATSAMSGMVGMPITPPGTLDLASGGYLGFGAFRRAVGGLRRGFGSGTTMGLEDRNLRGTPEYARMRREELSARFEDVGAEVGYGIVGAGIGSLFGPVGTLIGSAVGRDIIEPIIDPGAKIRRAGAGILNDMNVGGAGRYSREERTRFGREFSQMTRENTFFSRDEMIGGLQTAFETGAIKRRELGRSPEDLAKQTQEYMHSVRTAMRAMNLSIEEATQEVGLLMGRMKMTSRESNTYVTKLKQFATESGMTGAEAMTAAAQVGGAFQQLGMGGRQAMLSAPEALMGANRLIQAGSLNQFDVERLGGMAGVATAPIAAQAAFQQTSFGQAMVMSGYMGGGAGIMSSGLSSGAMSLQDALKPLRKMDSTDYLRFKGNQDRLNSEFLASGMAGASAEAMLRRMGKPIDKDTIAGLMVTRYGLDSSTAQVAAAAYLDRDKGIVDVGGGVATGDLRPQFQKAAADAVRSAYLKEIPLTGVPGEADRRRQGANSAAAEASSLVADVFRQLGPDASASDIEQAISEKINSMPKGYGTEALRNSLETLKGKGFTTLASKVFSVSSDELAKKASKGFTPSVLRRMLGKDADSDLLRQARNVGNKADYLKLLGSGDNNEFINQLLVGGGDQAIRIALLDAMEEGVSAGDLSGEVMRRAKQVGAGVTESQVSDTLRILNAEREKTGESVEQGKSGALQRLTTTAAFQEQLAMGTPEGREKKQIEVLEDLSKAIEELNGVLVKKKGE